MEDVYEIKFMKLALKEAKIALENGDYPVGAVLVIDGKVVGKERNCLYSQKNWASHAEATLIKENSQVIKDHVKNKSSKVELYTTLEPCLMCLGTLLLHRVSRVIYACPDPIGGAMHINPKNLTEWYEDVWPEIKSGCMKEEAFELMAKFMKKKSDSQKWVEVYNKFKEIKEKW